MCEGVFGGDHVGLGPHTRMCTSMNVCLSGSWYVCGSACVVQIPIQSSPRTADAQGKGELKGCLLEERHGMGRRCMEGLRSPGGRKNGWHRESYMDKLQRYFSRFQGWVIMGRGTDI